MLRYDFKRYVTICYARLRYGTIMEQERYFNCIKNSQNINYLQDVIDSIRDLNITQQKLDKFFIKN